MWITGKVDQSTQKSAVFADLYQECKLAAPGARLSHSIRFRLERFQREERQEIACQMKDGCTPLFIACKKGNVEIVEYLITVCDANVEQRGRYEVPDDRSVHNVTPLWCAAVAGRLAVVKCLVEHGANVNSMSDTGSTPVRSACFMTHLDIVKYLVENGADILKPNYNGGTCLINSVQSVPLCEFLLQKGALVNACDIQQKTALHYAIQEHRLETTKLLLQYGADPFLRSRYNDDALQTACLKGATQIFEHLIANVPYPVDRIADAYDLMGSTFLDEHHDVALALHFWRNAALLRARYNDPATHKRVLPPSRPFNFAREFETLEELENLALDLDAMRTQSLLICERILGPAHKDTIFRLMYRGAAYADSLRYQQCIDLWRYALYLRVQKDTILYNETCFTAQALVRLFLDMHEKFQSGLLAERLQLEDVISALELLYEQLKPSTELLKLRPVFKRQRENFDRILKCVTHLVFLLTVLSSTSDSKSRIESLVTRIVALNPRTSNGESLLHLTVSRSNTIKSNSYFIETQALFFPSLGVTQLLIDCGADVAAVDKQKSTALHVASKTQNYRPLIVDLLLRHGAHIDQRNAEGESSLRLLGRILTCTVHPLQYMSLKCLAARVVQSKGIPYKGEVPRSLEPFIEKH